MLAIDFSLNSTGITILTDSGYEFVSVVNTIDKSVLKSVDLLRDVINIHEYKRSPILSVKSRADGLDGWEQEHIRNVHYYSNYISDIISHYNPTEVILENYSYSSNSDALIQIVENTMGLKYELINRNIITPQQLYVTPAPVIKQHAGKGNYDKYQMLMAFINSNDPLLMNNDFYNYLKTNVDNHIKSRIKNGKPIMEVLTPISDIIDSYWILSHHINVRKNGIKN